MSSSQKDVPPWDVFQCFPPQPESGSMRRNKFEVMVWILKLLIYGVLFIIVLCSSVVAKSAVLFATSQLQRRPSVLYCHQNPGTTETNLKIQIILDICVCFHFLDFKSKLHAYFSHPKDALES